MATNQSRWRGNMFGANGPLIIPGKFQAGSTQAIKKGELLEFTGDTNSAWVPLDSDFDMRGNVAIAACEIKSGDREGYYPIIVPRPGDIFELSLATAAGTAQGTRMYYSDSETVTATVGTNVLATAVGSQGYPMQGHTADDASGDAGYTIRTQGFVLVTISAAASVFSLLHRMNAIDLGDAGGFTGLRYNPATTEIEVYIDGTFTHSFKADGTVGDEVS